MAPVSDVTNIALCKGQILVGGASAEFPSLRNAFFVGDQLIKRDCRLLQALAPNCRIVNMFGTTYVFSVFLSPLNYTFELWDVTWEYLLLRRVLGIHIQPLNR